MGIKVNKFTQISNIYSQFTEDNKMKLVRTAQSLLKVQHDSEKMLKSPQANGIGGTKKNVAKDR